jgi:hypothetical protein
MKTENDPRHQDDCEAIASVENADRPIHEKDAGAKCCEKHGMIAWQGAHAFQRSWPQETVNIQFEIRRVNRPERKG